MGMSYSNFLDLTPCQLINAIEGYYESEERRMRISWEQIRWMGSLVASKPVYGYKVKSVNPKQILPLPWDNEGAIPDEETLEYLRKDLEERNKKIRDGQQNCNEPNSSNLCE